MAANELADELEERYLQGCIYQEAATMLRQQQAKLTKYELRHAEQRKRIEELERLIQERTQENHDLWEQLHSESFDRTASHMAGEYVAHLVKKPMMVFDGNRVYPAFKELTDEEIKQVWNDNLAVMGNGLQFARAILRKAQLTCNGFCGEYECKENKTNCLRKAQEK